MTLTPNNERLTDEFYDLCKNLGVYPMLRHFEVTGRGLENYEYLKNNITAELHEKRIKERPPKPEEIKACNCAAGFRQLSINQNGDVIPCNVLCDKRYVFCSLLETDDLQKRIVDEVNSKISVFKQLASLEPDTMCKDCNVSLFCWHCLKEVENCQNDSIRCHNYCVGRKEYLTRLIWGENYSN